VSVKTFTSAATLESSPPRFPSDGRLNPSPNPPPNPGDSNGSGGLLLLLFSLPKVPNPPNGFAPIVPKCEKYPLQYFLC